MLKNLYFYNNVGVKVPTKLKILKMNNRALLTTLCIAVLFVFSLPTQAQTVVGLQAGVNFSGLQFSGAADAGQKTKLIPRPMAGLTVDIPVSQEFYIQPAAMYVGKGYKLNNGPADMEQEFRASASYVEVPLKLLYKKWIGIGKVVVGAGPYAGYGLGGRWKAETASPNGEDITASSESGSLVFKKDIADAGEGDHVYGKPWDYGANVVLGFQFSPRFTLLFHSQFGMANIAPDVNGMESNGTVRNRGYGASLALGF